MKRGAVSLPFLLVFFAVAVVVLRSSWGGFKVEFVNMTFRLR